MLFDGDPRFPTPLRLQIERAERLAGLLSVLYECAPPGDGARLWLTGRSEEVGAFVADVRDAWSRGVLPLERACAAISDYLRTLQRFLESWYGKRSAQSSTSFGRPRESLARRTLVQGKRANPSNSSLPRDTLPDGGVRLDPNPLLGASSRVLENLSAVSEVRPALRRPTRPNDG
jgi:hypothetical protein